MKSKRILFTNALLVDPAAGIFGERDVLVHCGRVEKLAPSLAPFRQWKQEDEALWIYDLKGRYLFPGLIDIHTHLRVPGGEHKETIPTGTMAAAAGGITTILAMPNTQPCIDRKSVLNDLKKQLSHEAKVHVLPVAAITIDQKGECLVDLEGLLKEGAVAFSDDGVCVNKSRVMRQALQEAARLGCPIISHSEDHDLAGGGAIQEGEIACQLGVKGIPSAAEVVMVARDLCLASDTQAHVHIAHVSTAKSLEMITMAKDKGVRVTAEVTPHHLTLSEETVLQFGSDAKVNPPLRTREDVKALQKALAGGAIDAIASDHAPHSPGEKGLSLLDAPFGIIGLETTLPVVLSLVRQEVISLKRAVELLTIGPARVMGLPGGTLGVGQIADLAVVDLEQSFTINVQEFYSKAKNCPFDGWVVKGRVWLTMVGGEIVFQMEGLLPKEGVTIL